MQTAATAAKAYASLASINSPTAAAAKSVQDSSGPGFGAMLNNVMNTASLGNPAAGAARSVQDVGGQNFGSLLKDAMGQVNQAARTGDAQSHAMVTGKANVVDVVTAVAESEVAVDALVAVRDRVVAAYEEIMRMPI
ncbi:flagellar hook-basal body complex protein FliE [Pseudorhodoplanes sinuspersici]|nr:flagellar hook-basal body complex protein FliE [Pseudorhodoplanes sinuspersici]